MTYSDGSLVHRTVGVSKEDVHDDGDRNAAQIHAERRADEEATPKLGICVFDLLNAVFRPSVREIHQQNQTEKQEQDRSTERDIVSPDFEESVWYQEGEDHQAQPCNDLRSPESILDRCTAVFRAVYPKK